MVAVRTKRSFHPARCGDVYVILQPYSIPSKRRDPGANWYGLSFAERKVLMAGHARVGRTYAGRVLQLIHYQESGTITLLRYLPYIQAAGFVLVLGLRLAAARFGLAAARFGLVVAEQFP